MIETKLDNVQTRIAAMFNNCVILNKNSVLIAAVNEY